MSDACKHLNRDGQMMAAFVNCPICLHESQLASHQAELARVQVQRDGLREALSRLLDAIAEVGGANWERALDEACLLAGRYCEPWTEMPNPSGERTQRIANRELLKTVFHTNEDLRNDLAESRAECQRLREECDAMIDRHAEIFDELEAAHARTRDLTKEDLAGLRWLHAEITEQMQESRPSYRWAAGLALDALNKLLGSK